MKIDETSLKKLEEFKGYLDNDRVTDLLSEFEIGFAAGHWCAGDFVDRFATEGYNEGMSSDILDQIPRVAAAKIKGIEFHDNIFLDERGNINEDKITEVSAALEKYNLTPTNMNTNLWGMPKWKLGGVCNPDKAKREAAVQVLMNAIDIAKKIGCGSVAYWPGSDGWPGSSRRLSRPLRVSSRCRPA